MPTLAKPTLCVLNPNDALVNGRSLRFALPFNESIGLTGPATEVHDLINPTIPGVLNTSGTTIIDGGAPYGHVGRTGAGGSDVFKWDGSDLPTMFPGGPFTHGTLALLGRRRSGGGASMFRLEGASGATFLVLDISAGGDEIFGASGQGTHWNPEGIGGPGASGGIGVMHLWHLVRGGSSLKLYMDGALAPETLDPPFSPATGPASRNDLTTALSIGTPVAGLQVGGFAGFSTGNMDTSDAWVWLGGAEAELTPDEIAEHWADPWRMYRYSGHNPIARIFGGTHARQIVGRRGVKVTPVADVPVQELFVETDEATFPTSLLRRGGRGTPGRDGEDGEPGIGWPGRRGLQGIQGVPGADGTGGGSSHRMLWMPGDDPEEPTVWRGQRGVKGDTGAAGADGAGGDAVALAWGKAFFTDASVLPTTERIAASLVTFPVEGGVAAGTFTRTTGLATCATSSVLAWYDLGAARSTILAVINSWHSENATSLGLVLSAAQPTTVSPDGYMFDRIGPSTSQFRLMKRVSGVESSLTTVADPFNRLLPAGVAFYYDDATGVLKGFVRIAGGQWFQFINTTDSTFTTFRYLSIRHDNSGTSRVMLPLTVWSNS